MKVVTYYEEIAGAAAPAKLLGYWVNSWQRNGFETVMATAEHAKAHPEYQQWYDWAMTAPTVNDRIFEVACWMRWLAYEQFAPAVFADYDIINWTLKPEDVPEDSFAFLGGAMVHATAAGIRRFIHYWPKCPLETVHGKPHVSDAYAIMRYWDYIIHQQSRLCVCPDQPDVLTAPCVHFGNVYVKPEWRFHERWRAFEDMNQRRAEYAAAQLAKNLTH